MFAKLYARYYDQVYQKKRYKDEIAFVYKWAERPKTVLDIGCGTASYWQYFPRDVELTGVEQSVDMIKQSKHKNNIIYDDVRKTMISASLFPATYDCAIALFDVINYIPEHTWWQDLPIKKGGYLIFDVWDKKKVDRDGFRLTIQRTEGICRVIKPLSYDFITARLEIWLGAGKEESTEIHTMYVHDEKDIAYFAGKHFEIVDKKSANTKTWQTFYKLRRLQ
jgi:SAM-dependent methyltransferase